MYEVVVQDISCNPSNAKAPPTPSSIKPNEESSVLQTSHLQPVLCDTSYLANSFPMYEHVGVDEEGMYGVEVVPVSIPSIDVV